MEERTQELQRLYSQLQEREQWREELLRKVISAQEDERKRLARELHDETSQTLSALAMKIETALAGVARRGVARAARRGQAPHGAHARGAAPADLRPAPVGARRPRPALGDPLVRRAPPRAAGIAVRCEFSGVEAPPVAGARDRALPRRRRRPSPTSPSTPAPRPSSIQCLERDDRIAIEIEDDGRGVRPGEPAAAGRAGTRPRPARHARARRAVRRHARDRLGAGPGHAHRRVGAARASEVQHDQHSGPDRRRSRHRPRRRPRAADAVRRHRRSSARRPTGSEAIELARALSARTSS